MDIFEKCYEFTQADDAKAQGVYPYFHALQSRPDTVVNMEGKRRIMLGSNNYLGLTVCEEVIEAGRKALDKYGTGCSGSRFLNGTLDLHLELEEELARFLRKEDCITFSTGFQSNLGIISAVAGFHDYIICDRENHASIYDACRLSHARTAYFKHNDMEDLESVLSRIDDKFGKLIVTDGVFSMSGDIANLPEIVRLAKKYGARIMVDDAHGLGTIGEGGRGTAEYYGLADDIDIYMGTFSKSLASLGGYMASKAKVIDYVKHMSRPFIFSASITPVSCATALAALRYLEKHPEIVTKLNDLASYARKGFEKRGIPIIKAKTPIIPVYTYTLENTIVCAKKIYEGGVYVNTVLPPATEPNACLLRTSYMATLTDELIDEALDVVAKVVSDSKIAVKA